MLKRDFIFVVIFIAAVINDCIACFRSNEHQTKPMATGNPYYQECQCTEHGYTTKDLMWLDNNDRLIEAGPGPGTSNAYTEETPESINLYIPNISKSTSGEYKCVTKVEGIKYVQSYTIDAYDPLYFFNTPTDQHLIFGEDSLITCEARGESLPFIGWQKEIGDEFVEIFPFAEKYQKIREGLIVRNVSQEDAGKYKCTALVYSTGEEVEKFIYVNIHTAPVIQELRAHPGTTVIAGGSLSVDCVSEGVPTPQYKWMKIETDDSNNTVTWKQNVNTISFENIQAEDDGIYECHAYNEAGVTKRQVNLEVLVAPVITDFINITESEGTTIQLICNASGKPEPNITIIYEGWDVSSDWELSEYYTIPNKAFVNLQRTNEGIYVCNASNEVGYDEVPMYLTVLHRPYFRDQNIAHSNDITVWGYDGKIVKLNCAHTSNPPAVVTWSFRSENSDVPMEKQVEINKLLLDIHDQFLIMNIDTNSTYGIYTCTARNELGEATKQVTLREGFRPPPIDTVINTTDITASTVTFQIESLIIRDIPEILGYTAEYDEESNYEITDIHPNRTWSLDRPFKIEKLKPNTTYRVSFAAVNEVGAGEFGEEYVFVTLEKSVPEPPALEENPIRLSSSESLPYLLKWKETADNGEPIDYYILKYCPVYNELDDTLCEVRQVKAPASELELTDLESNTTYFMELVAHNSEGNSTSANISITIPALKNGEPATLLSGGAIIGISILIVLVCLLLLDLLLLGWRRQGVIASVFLNKDTKRKEDALNSRDRKGLLIVEPVDTRPDNGHKEYEYNKNTGVITGKHSAV